MLTLLFVCAFFSTQVQKYLAWVLIRFPSGGLPRYARNDKVLRTEEKRMKSIAKTDKVFVWFILCHSEELHSNDVRIPRKGYLVINQKI